MAENTLVTLTAVIAALGTITSGIVAVVVLRIQRDNAQLENRILAAINGKYISRKEHDILCRDHEAKMTDAAASAKEARAQHHILHEEFIACRAKHEALEG